MLAQFVPCQGLVIIIKTKFCCPERSSRGCCNTVGSANIGLVVTCKENLWNLLHSAVFNGALAIPTEEVYKDQ